MKINELDTPALLVDLDRVERNVRRWQSYCDRFGIRNRPHIKTHKCPELAQLQIQAGACGITCQKLGEAEAMAKGGIQDILLAYNVVGKLKLERLNRLRREVRVSVVADSNQVVSELLLAAAGAEQPLPVLVEVASGLNRCGVPTPEAAVALASFIARQPGLDFQGFLSYPSDSRTNSIFQAASLAAKKRGLTPKMLSGGGTPGMWNLAAYTSLTEYRAGTYIYNDRTIVNGNAAALEDCALTVLVTVVSTTAGEWAVVDGGSKTFSSDQFGLKGFGVELKDSRLLLERCTEEHGMVTDGGKKPKVQVGSQLRFIPNHACAVSNLHDTVYAVRGEEVIAKWSITARGKVQ